jgi:hypothetical protein
MPVSRVLVVAHRTAATPALLEAVRKRAAAGQAEFVLLVPRSLHGLHRVVDPADGGVDEAQAVLDLALPLLEEAAGSPVRGIVGDAEPVNAAHDAVNGEHFDEIIISTLSPRMSRWLHMDVPHRLNVLGLPVTTVSAKGAAAVADPA